MEILPALWGSHERGIAAGMYFHEVVFVAAMRATRLTQINDPVRSSANLSKLRRCAEALAGVSHDADGHPIELSRLDRGPP